MILTRASVTSFLLVTAAAYKVPAGLPDGLYVDSLDVSGYQALRALSSTGFDLGPVNLTALESSDASLIETKVSTKLDTDAGAATRAHARDLQLGHSSLVAREDWEGLPISEHDCRTNKEAGLNPSDYIIARGRFGDWCRNHEMGGRQIIYEIQGSAVVYGCSHGGAQPCSAEEFGKVERFLDTKCGTLRVGWVWMGDWKKVLGRDLSYNDICTNL